MSYDPWGKGAGAPRRDSRGNVERFKASDTVTGIQTNVYTDVQVSTIIAIVNLQTGELLSTLVISSF